ncbi:Mitochondrial chaperone BCS1 [Hypsibius exemplaris]|uniref:Mitochondrial chaperone BCS1 n=1 Tax=Hypsibius exemplaris TaxID=2072580 RepID=A0A1W0WBF6_HYPEX|nr:Mitochondrial chaperone BCS1 [Hypsibius exemplaris]
MRSVFFDLLSFVGNDAFISVRIAVIFLAVLIALCQKLFWDVSLFDYLADLCNNPYFGATFSLVGLGACLAALQQMWSMGQHFYSSYLTCSVEIPSTDESFSWVLQWIYASRLKNPLHLSVETTHAQNTSGKKAKNRFDFVPATGMHHFSYKNKWIQISRNKAQTDNSFCLRPMEMLVLRTSGRDTSIFRDILEEASTYVQTKNQGKTTIFYAMNGCWSTLSTPLHKRPVESVVLDRGVAEKITSDLEHFVDHSEWYLNRGIPYRRGYLLYGPPGTGKTSFIMALAGLFNLNICILNLSERWLTDDVFNQLLCNSPQDSLFLLEDVDAAFLNRERDRNSKASDAAAAAGGSTTKNVAFDGMSRLTFSGFLNAIDGAASAEGRILFMTTNYVDRLDPALLRPGRIDLSQHIGFASEYQLQKIYLRFYPEESEKAARSFASLAVDTAPSITMAQVQGLFLLHKYDPRAVFDDLALLSQSFVGIPPPS